MTSKKNIGSALALLLCISSQLDAHEPARDAKHDTIVAPLLAKDLVDQPGKEITMLTVEYPPGGASKPHRHDAQVFVYVLQGALRTQVEGQAAVTLQAGQTFYEQPHDIHITSANASATEPVKFLVVMVKDKNRAASLPLSGDNNP